MAVLIDPPRWPAHGRVWSHLASDTSLDELHAFAGASGIPRRAFEGDHYDVPAELYARAVAAGAEEVEGRELLRRLVEAGLRVPKRRGERVLTSERRDGGEQPGLHAVDLVLSVLGAPADGSLAAWGLVRDGDGNVLLAAVGAAGAWTLPGGRLAAGDHLDDPLRRALATTGVRPHGGAHSLGYRRVRPLGSAAGARGGWTYQVVLALSAHGPAGERSAWHPAVSAVDALRSTPWGPLVAHAVEARPSPGPRSPA